MNKKGMVRLAPTFAKATAGRHKVPADLRKVLISTPATKAAWEDIMPLARNEWICWIESVKKPETRKLHIERTRTELMEGKRRPCCWAGCRHTITILSNGRMTTTAPLRRVALYRKKK